MWSRQYLSSSLPRTRLSFLFGRNYIDVHKIAVVCSARSGLTKTLGTTNLLLKASSQALQRPALGRRQSSGFFTPGASQPSRNHQWYSPLHSPNSSSGSPPSYPVLPNDELSSTLMMSSALAMSSIPQSEKDDLPFFETVDLIRSEHMTAARSSITNPDILKELEKEIEEDCGELQSFLRAIQVGFHSH